MNTIKIPVKVTTVEETFVEVETPCYTRAQSHLYRVSGNNDKKQVVQVFCALNYTEGTSIQCSSLDLAFYRGYELITKAEYDEQFEKALSILKGEQL